MRKSLPFLFALLPHLLACGGDGTGPDRDHGVAVRWAAMTASLGGFDYTCGLTDAGTAYCWGDNSNGQLGDGSTTESRMPVRTTGGLTFSMVTAGWRHTCGLAQSGTAYCWGATSIVEGNAGSGPKTPVRVSGELKFRMLSAGNFYTCGVTENGAAHCWSGQSASPAAVPGGLKFTMLAAGMNYTCGVSESGAAYCWGSNSDGQLGNGSPTDSQVPVQVAGGLRFEMISARVYHTCGITEGGAAFCWGQGALGYAWPPNTNSSISPVPRAVEGGLTFRTISVASEHTCGLTEAGAAYCWGHGALGQLGHGKTTGSTGPVAVSGGLTFTSLAAGGSHTCGTTVDGAAYCWGLNIEGQLGDGSARTTANDPYADFRTVPTRVKNPPS